MKWALTFSCLSLAGIITLTGYSQEAQDAVQLQVVKYDGLKDAVLKNKGKVILIDFWGNF